MTRVNNKDIAVKKESILKHIEDNTKIIENKIKKVYKASMDRITVKFDRLARKIEKEGLTVNNISALQRLRSLYQDIFNEMKRLDPKVYRWIMDSAEKAYKSSYYENWFIAEKSLEIPFTFNRLNPARVRAIVKTPFPGTSLEELIVTLKQKAFKPVQFELAVGQAIGSGPKEIAKKMLEAGDIFKAQYNNASYMAVRIARTESLRAASYANIEMTQQLEEAGVKYKKQWLATLDDRTREDHRIMDGNYADDNGVFHLPDGSSGLAPRLTGVAEQDINCRCSYTEFIEGISQELQAIREEQNGYMEVNGKQIKYSALQYDDWKAGKGL